MGGEERGEEEKEKVRMNSAGNHNSSRLTSSHPHVNRRWRHLPLSPSHLFGRALHAGGSDVFPVGRLLHRGHPGDGRRGRALLQVLLLPEQELLLVLRHDLQVASTRAHLEQRKAT